MLDIRRHSAHGTCHLRLFGTVAPLQQRHNYQHKCPVRNGWNLTVGQRVTGSVARYTRQERGSPAAEQSPNSGTQKRMDKPHHDATSVLGINCVIDLATACPLSFRWLIR
jgi:hypothetical protein